MPCTVVAMAQTVRDPGPGTPPARAHRLGSRRVRGAAPRPPGPAPGRGGSGASTRIPRRSYEGYLPSVVSVPSSMSGRYALLRGRGRASSPEPAWRGSACGRVRHQRRIGLQCGPDPRHGRCQLVGRGGPPGRIGRAHRWRVLDATGEYISMRAQSELMERELAVERDALRHEPEVERKELAALYESRGLDAELAEELSVKMMRNPEIALETHAREELGINPKETGK